MIPDKRGKTLGEKAILNPGTLRANAISPSMAPRHNGHILCCSEFISKTQDFFFLTFQCFSEFLLGRVGGNLSEWTGIRMK